MTFLTSRYGRVRLAARRQRKGLPAPFLDVLQGGELLFRPADEKRPGGLISFDADRIWPRIRGDYGRLLTGLHFCCLAGAMATEGEGDTGLYRLLNAMLGHLDEGGDLGSLRVVFELRLLAGCGYGSSLDSCSCCGAASGEGEISLSAAHGGLVCRTCRDTRGGAATILSPGALSVMRRSLLLSLEKTDRLKVLPSLQRAVLSFTGEMIARVTERPVPSAVLLDRLPAGGKGPPQDFDTIRRGELP